MNSLNPIHCALFLTAAFVLAGLLQSCWLKSACSRRYFGAPLDGQRTWGGRRIFGDNKTYRGFVGMVPAVGVSFLLLHGLVDRLPSGTLISSPGLVVAGNPADGGAGSAATPDGLWPLSAAEYALLGCWVGLGFMLGELPNSFIKRRLGIAPGEPPPGRRARPICFLADRLDSILGGLVALALIVPVPLVVWIVILVIGPGFHWSFNVLLFHWGVKARPA